MQPAGAEHLLRLVQDRLEDGKGLLRQADLCADRFLFLLHFRQQLLDLAQFLPVFCRGRGKQPLATGSAAEHLHHAREVGLSALEFGLLRPQPGDPLHGGGGQHLQAAVDDPGPGRLQIGRRADDTVCGETDRLLAHLAQQHLPFLAMAENGPFVLLHGHQGHHLARTPRPANSIDLRAEAEQFVEFVRRGEQCLDPGVVVIPAAIQGYRPGQGVQQGAEVVRGAGDNAAERFAVSLCLADHRVGDLDDPFHGLVEEVIGPLAGREPMPETAHPPALRCWFAVRFHVFSRRVKVSRASVRVAYLGFVPDCG